MLRSHGSGFILDIRPEYIRIASEKGLVKARCVIREDLGTAVLLHLETRGGITLKAKPSPETSVKEGDDVYIEFPREKVRIFKKTGESCSIIEISINFHRSGNISSFKQYNHCQSRDPIIISSYDRVIIIQQF